MNLIEAWKKAKNKNILKRTNSKGDDDCLVKEKSKNLREHICEYSYLCREESILADDWEIVKEKKNVVIEDVKWANCGCGGLHIYPQAFGDFHALLNKPPMRMTLEWSEE